MNGLDAIMLNAIRYRLTLHRVDPLLFRDDIRWLLAYIDRQHQLLKVEAVDEPTIAGMDELE